MAGLQRRPRWRLRILLLLALTVALLNANWAQGALVANLYGQACPAALLAGARERVAKQYGAVQSAPLIACLQAPALGVSVSHGQTRFAPLLPAVVLLGPEGLNLDVAAHEWSHAELSERVGVLVRSWRMPTWFDEGLAMQVDLRSGYQLQSGARRADALPALATLASGDGFFTADEDLARLRYGYARCVIAQWQAQQASGSDQARALVAWLQQLSLWQRFPAQAFYAVEPQCRADHVPG